MPAAWPESIRRADTTLAADSAAWLLPIWARWWLLGLPIVLAALVAFAGPHPNLYHFLVDEDRVIEWSQFFAILAASLVFAVAGRRAWQAGRRNMAILFALVAIGAFVVAGEEISWGQRILGLQTPEALREINHQDETNIHNINGLQRVFNLGELVVGLYGFAVPSLLAVPGLRARLAARIDRLLVPPLALGTMFFLPFLYRAVRATVLPTAGERLTEFGEVPEFTLYLAILISGIVIVRALARTSIR